jgi:hypothetical protein
MSKIFIKIVEIHQPSQSVVIKFSSEYSAKTIDEYEGLAFTVSNFNSLTPSEFIENIRAHLTKLVIARDRAEKLVESLDVSSWLGYTTEFDAVEPPSIDPTLTSQLLAGLSNPEVIL